MSLLGCTLLVSGWFLGVQGGYYYDSWFFYLSFPSLPTKSFEGGIVANSENRLGAGLAGPLVVSSMSLAWMITQRGEY